jgi:hypothetical protein
MSALRFQNHFVVVLVIWSGYSHVISVGSGLTHVAFCDLKKTIRYDDYCENVLWVIHTHFYHRHGSSLWRKRWVKINWIQIHVSSSKLGRTNRLLPIYHNLST